MTYHFYEEQRWQIFWRCSPLESGTHPTGKNPVERWPARLLRPIWPFCYWSHGNHKYQPTPQLHLTQIPNKNKKKKPTGHRRVSSHERYTKATTYWSTLKPCKYYASTIFCLGVIRVRNGKGSPPEWLVFREKTFKTIFPFENEFFLRLKTLEREWLSLVLSGFLIR